MLALVAVVVPTAKPVWVLVTTRSIPMPTARENEPWEPKSIPMSVNPDVGRGWIRVKRWADPPVAHGTAAWYRLSSGYKGAEHFFEDGGPLRETHWRSDGTVLSQRRVYDEHGNRVEPYTEAAEKSSPPGGGA